MIILGTSLKRLKENNVRYNRVDLVRLGRDTLKRLNIESNIEHRVIVNWK